MTLPETHMAPEISRNPMCVSGFRGGYFLTAPWGPPGAKVLHFKPKELMHLEPFDPSPGCLFLFFLCFPSSDHRFSIMIKKQV